MMKHLYSLQRGKESILFVVGKDHCDDCEKLLSGMVFHLYSKSAGEYVFCGNCYRRVTPLTKLFTGAESRAALAVREIPVGALPVLSPVGFSFGNPEDAPTQGVKIIDRTRRAGRPGYTLDPSVQIGKSEAALAIEDHWKNDVVSLLEFHADEDNILLPGNEEEQRLIE